MAAQVLDSYALLAYFRGEAGGAKVRALLERAGAAGRAVRMTEVNYAEVKYIVLRAGGPRAWEGTAAILDALPIEFIAVDRHLADLAAEIKARFRLSLADACAAALAKDTKSELVTGDLEFRQMERELRIAWLA